jgi:hypothetical protein
MSTPVVEMAKLLNFIRAKHRISTISGIGTACAYSVK